VPIEASERTTPSRAPWSHAALAVAFALAVGLSALPLANGQQRARPVAARTFYRGCSRFLHPDTAGSFLSSEDVHPPVAPIDGDDLLALVNRSPRWTLASTYIPSDLVDVRTMQTTPSNMCRPPDHQCLRREAATALRAMMAAMRTDHQEPYIDSAYRSYDVQCTVFQMWAYRDHHGFCNATVFSALPGHSQHQLGTAVDLFTRAWVYGGERFREGFGCSPGGRWIAEHGWEHGFVLPYPLHPDYRDSASMCAPRTEAIGRVDPRTGYKYEPWHLRYIGVASAAQFHSAWLASHPGTAEEITLEQWLRDRLGAQDAVEPPVCDGCNCGSCATFRDPAQSAAPGPCNNPSVVLTRAGTPVTSNAEPAIVDAAIERVDDGTIRVRATVEVPTHTFTQPPIVDSATDIRFGGNQSIDHLVVIPGGVTHAYPLLPGTWRFAVSTPDRREDPPWQVALVEPTRDGLANGVNARIPASTGPVSLEFRIDGIRPGASLEVALVRTNQRIGTRTIVVR
jgi:D-alanyl-D-alanine carboxypeptidase